MDADSWILHGRLGWGSAIVELALAFAGIDHVFVDLEGFEDAGPACDRLVALNPLAQVPTVVLPDGQVMTESAAILLHLADVAPAAELVPAPGDSARPAFLRRLIWLVAAVYPTFLFADFPECWAPDAADQLRDAVVDHRQRLFLEWEATLPATGWAMGERVSALDLYAAVMVHWSPGRAWFAAHCPRLVAIAARVRADPRLTAVMDRNFPERVV